MKFLTQVVLPILLVVALIGGVTFVSQYSGSGKTPKRVKASAKEAAFELNPPLQNGEAVAEWDKLSLPRLPDFEIFTENHYDFSLHNRGQAALTVGLVKKSCDCAKVSVTATDAGERWQELDTEGTKTATVPAGGRALVRMRWEGRKPERRDLRARLWIDRGLPGRDEPVLVVPVNFVPPIQVDKDPVKVPDLTGGSPRQKVEFPCWSSTRASFPLTVKEESGSPCFICEAKPLTAEDREKLATEQKCRVLSGYRVTVTISEHQGDRLLDLGPYRRRLLLQAGAAESESAVVALEGMVRGEVAFLNPADKDRIDLGDFPASQGAGKTVPLMTEQDGQQLELDSWTPALLSVKLVPAAGKRWELTVEVPANRQRGRLPNDSAVIVRTKGAGSRRMRIPVVGQAYTTK